MNLSNVSLNLAAIKVPEPKPEKAKGWAQWGAAHKFPKEVLGYIRKSPTAMAMLMRKAAFIAGEGFNAGENEALKKWLDNVSGDQKLTKLAPLSANRLLRRLGLDAAFLEGMAMQVGWAKDGKSLAWLKPQRIETLVAGLLNDEQQIEKYYISRDWSKLNEFPAQEIPAYNPAKAKSEPVQLWVYFPEAPGVEYYTALSYASALPYMQAEARLATYHDNNIRTRFALGAIVKIRKGPEDKRDENGNTITARAQRDAYQEGFKSKLEGEEGEKLLFLWGDGDDDSADKMADIQPFSTANGETYETVAALAQQAILSAGQVTSPVVVGLPGQGGLGGNASEIREAYEMYNNTVCRPWQVVLLEIFTELAQYVPGVGTLEDDPDSPALEIISSMPVKFRFGEDTLAGVLTDDEIRNVNDFAAAPKPEGTEEGAVVQTEAQKNLSGSVGGQTSIDAMLALLSQGLTTRESCIARLKTFFGLSEADAQAIVPQPAEQAQTAPGAL